jgi:hypothetical protein
LDYAVIIEELRGILVDSKDEEALVRYFLAINHENLAIYLILLTLSVVLDADQHPADRMNVD